MHNISAVHDSPLSPALFGVISAYSVMTLCKLKYSFFFFVAHKRKKRNWEENDYYDSDEDTFLDRTGTSK